MSPIPSVRHLLLLAATSTALQAQDDGGVPIDLPVMIEDVPAGGNPLPDAGSQNFSINLINRLVEKGIFSQAEAAELIRQAEQDTALAQAQADAIASMPAPLDPLGPGDVQVTFIPEVVRKQMRDEIQQELMATAREENWSAKAAPDWTSRIRLFGDFRGRHEGIFFDDGNQIFDTSGNLINSFTNFNAINAGAPYDVTNPNLNNPPLYNIDQDRNRARLRARLGAEILLGEGFTGGIRLASGESSSPVSTNQTLGAGRGNFSKYAIWLDRAFFSYDAGPGNGDGEELLFLAGRFANPFFSTEVSWDNDIGFDGLAVRGNVRINDQVSTFFTAGAFPIFNTDLNFASNQAEKFASEDRWLYGAQVGIDWKIQDDLSAKVGVSYYDFSNVRGRLSSPFVPLSAADPGDTDATRAGFSQRGNTYMPLRNITPDAANDFGTRNQFQYYGLASDFRNLTLTGRLDYDRYETMRFSAIGEVTKNLGFDRDGVASRAFSDGRPGRTLANSPSDFVGGDMAWNLAFQFGRPVLQEFGDWQGVLGYRYVESDAVMDAFTDSDFGGGGTNLKGFHLGAIFALSPHVNTGIRWMSASEVDGPPLRTDTLMLDLNAKF